jgi:AraC-like DNA-binding protein
MLGLAVEGSGDEFPIFDLESEFAAKDDLVPEWFDGFADEFLIGERAIGFRRVEEVHSHVVSFPDHGDGIIAAPGQVLTVENYLPDVKPKGKVLLIHPDFLRGTALNQLSTDYTFFSYAINEALHLSKKELKQVLNMFETIEEELQQNLDKQTKTLVISHLQLLLNYSIRFYDRQFITRDHVNKGIVEWFEHILKGYFTSEKPQTIGLPTVSYCAEELHLSANYFGDLIKRETGITALEYIQTKVIDVAKDRIFDMDKSISEIAYDMGFKYPQHFTRLFKQKTGVTPIEYRNLN